MSKIAQKSPIFPPPVYLTPPMKGLPLEFGIGVRGPECFCDGAIRWSKKFSHTFSRFDTIPAVTDSHPPSHPASHVAVAITLNAKASSLKSDYVTSQFAAYVTKSLQMSEDTNNSVNKLMTDNMQLVLINVLIQSIFQH